MFQRIPAVGQSGLGFARGEAGLPFLALEPIAARDRDPHAEMQHHHRQDHARHGGRQRGGGQIADQQRDAAGQPATDIAAKAGRHDEVEDQRKHHQHEDGYVAARTDEEGDTDGDDRLPGKADAFDRAKAGHAMADRQAGQRPEDDDDARWHSNPEMISSGKAPVANQEQGIEDGR